ncbi:serine hydrolase domain-containing protein [Photobacterium sanguinicancri]|uniref:serine hydrolase domain-containing protein n=1 Tax=Photobacterium sanguinicancri TaxID=875932 RepID=UPI000AE32CC7|nr:serine hydrolase domain-containing protein [Photobacterium sanguinicancri]
MQSLRRTCFGVISLLMMAASGNATSASKDEIVYALDDWVKQAVTTSIPGASLAVVVNGQIRLLRGYGVAKVGSKQRVTSSTRFPLASISKTFASAATSLLVDKQLIDWDTHVVPYLEHIEFSDPQQGSAVTLRHLLSHTSDLCLKPILICLKTMSVTPALFR